MFAAFSSFLYGYPHGNYKYEDTHRRLMIFLCVDCRKLVEQNKNPSHPKMSISVYNCYQIFVPEPYFDGVELESHSFIFRRLWQKHIKICILNADYNIRVLVFLQFLKVDPFQSWKKKLQNNDSQNSCLRWMGGEGVLRKNSLAPVQDC